MNSDEIIAKIHHAFNNFTTRPAGYALLGRGDNSGVIVADSSNRLLYYFTVNQPPTTAPLVDTINILPYIGIHKELEGVRVRLGYPPERPNVLHIVGFDQGEGITSVAGITPEEQLQASQKYVDTGSLVNFRLSPNSPVDNEVYVNPGWYIDADGLPAWWGGDSTDTLLTTAIAALTPGQHQMAAVYLDNSTGKLGILTGPAEAGGVNDKQLFDSTTIVDMTWPEGYVPCGSVHLYYGRTLNPESDIYRTADPRIVFNATGTGGGDGITQLTGDVTAGPGSGSQAATLATVNSTTGTFAYPSSITANGKGLITNIVAGSAPGTMSSFEVGADSGANEPVTNGQLVDFLGGDAIETSVASPRMVYIGVMDEGITNDKIAFDTITIDKLATTPSAAYFIVGFDSTGLPDYLPNGDIINGVLGETCTINDFVIQKADDLWYKADATTASLVMAGYGRRGVIVSGTPTSGSTVRIMRQGYAYDFTGLTPSDVMYASTTPGGYTQTEPTPSLGGSEVLIAPWGQALFPSVMWVDTYQPVRYMTRLSMANNATTTLVHQADNTLSTRQTLAAVSSTDIAVIETSGGAQDSSRQLRGQSGAGALVTVDTAGTTLAALGDNSGNEFRVAQSVTLTAGVLSQITFNTGTSAGTPSGPATIEIQTNGATIPSGTVLYTGTQAITASSTITHTVTGGPFLDAGVYWIVVSVPAQATNSRFSVQYSSTNPYAGGQMKADSSASAGTWAVALTGGASADMRCTITTAAQVTTDGLSQGFSHSSTTTVTSANILLKRTGTLAGSLTLAIYASSGGLPTSVITNGTATTVAASTVNPASYALVSFTFPTPPTITASTQYHLVLTTSDSASNTAYIEWGIDISSPPYANGVFALLQSASWANASPAADGLFDLYGSVGTFGTTAVPGFWFSTRTDIVTRFDNGSGSNATTNTTFKNVSGSTLDVTCIVEMP